MRKVLASALLLALGGFGQSAFAVQSEAFDSAASAAANGWVAVGNGVNGQTVGWIDTNEAGGAPGEAQFDIGRGAQTMYADTDLGLTINGNGAFEMTGKMNLAGFLGGDTGFPPGLGFFSSPLDYVGIIFRAEAGINWGLRFGTTVDGLIVPLGGTPNYHLDVDTPYTFSLSYDPNEGAFGTFRAHVHGAGPEIVHALSEAHRNVLNTVEFDKAGLFKPGNAFDPETIQLRVDDLTYTAVPEPSTIVTALLCAVTVGVWRSRRAV